MATATVPPKPQTQSLLPKLSPYVVPNLLCPNRKCSQILTNPQVGISKSTGEQVVWFNCPHCHYDAELPLVHSNARVAPEGKLNVKGPSEGIVGQL
jgi:hypothetical protein